MNKPLNKKMSVLVKKTLLIILLFLFICCSVIFVKGYYMYTEALKENPLEEKISSIRARENYTPLAGISEYYLDGVLAIEDHNFYDHGAVNIVSISRAFLKNIINMRLMEGGSTISQQLAKNIYFSSVKKFSRKAAEALMAIHLENALSKDEILEMYVNEIYFGNGYYGIYAAAWGYFNKLPSELDFYQATVLAGIPQAPSVYNLEDNLAKTMLRREKVIDAMVKFQYIDEKTAASLDAVTAPGNGKLGI
jgi:membrane peptidoglycan carboxypeptidase